MLRVADLHVFILRQIVPHGVCYQGVIISRQDKGWHANLLNKRLGAASLIIIFGRAETANRRGEGVIQFVNAARSAILSGPHKIGD